MARSHSVVIVHVVFRVKRGGALIHHDSISGLCAMMTTLLEEMGCNVIAANGSPDHIHILFRLPRTSSISHVAQVLKANSSRWAKYGNPSYANFAWQGGYGAFSVDNELIPNVKSYISHERSRHTDTSSADEYLGFLDKCGEPYFPIGSKMHDRLTAMTKDEIIGTEQTHCLVAIHLVFHIKDVSALIRDQDIPIICALISEALKNDGCTPIAIGGIYHHMHVLFRLSRNQSIADVAENVKSYSCLKIKQYDPHYEFFAWQRGYGAFSVSNSRLPTVISYIQNQKQHHIDLTFADELTDLLNEHGEATTQNDLAFD